MSRTYKYVVRGCGSFAVIGAAIYATVALAALAEGPDSGLRLPLRLNAVILFAIATTAGVGTIGWLIQEATKCLARMLGNQVAADVSVAVLGTLEQRMVVVAERTASSSGEQVVTAIRAIAEAVADGLTTRLGEQLETWLDRAHTQGMTDEARVKSATVAHLNSRRGD